MSSSASSDPGAQAVPTCFRHPDRETYVRCTRCDRPICPECMREAPVGHQCVQCVAEGQKSVPRTRTVFGGAVAQRPYVTLALLGLIVVGFLAQAVVPQLTWLLGMWGGMVQGQVVGGVMAGQWYRLITAAFLHGGIVHLLFNGFALFIIGRQLEDWLGAGRYLALWVLSALGGSVLSLLVQPEQLSVGASGAIFGLFGAIFVIGRRLGKDTRFVVGLLVINLLLTFTVPQISWTGHVGGLVTGLALAAAYAYLPRSAPAGPAGQQARTRLHIAATVVCVLVLGLLAAAGVLYWQR
ncbi:MAG: rhomboid family intramembrane serine protease [Nocardiopsaceae bacterium]|nr:rhomboid family intramembrane serine protease [Nocardiopsaceae bacterium]